MVDRHIVAIGDGGFSDDDRLLDGYILSLVDAARPKVCFVPTGKGDGAESEARFYSAFVALGCEPRVLRLFRREIEDLRSFVLEQDVVYVGGGNTANLLAVWRMHGLHDVLQEAWEAGIVLCGVSAGANCWFEASVSDSFQLGSSKPLNDGLGFLSGSFCPHYDSAPERRREFHQFVASHVLPPGLACDDRAAVHFTDERLHKVIASRSAAGVARIEPGDDAVVETRLDVVQL